MSRSDNHFTFAASWRSEAVWTNRVDVWRYTDLHFIKIGLHVSNGRNEGMTAAGLMVWLISVPWGPQKYLGPLVPKGIAHLSHWSSGFFGVPCAQRLMWPRCTICVPKCLKIPKTPTFLGEIGSKGPPLWDVKSPWFPKPFFFQWSKFASALCSRVLHSEYQTFLVP